MKTEILQAINTLKTYLGMEVKLEQMKLVDGATLEADKFEAGYSVKVLSTNGEMVPLPTGPNGEPAEYELENGMILVVTEEGVIAEVKEAPLEEENPEEAQTEVPVEASNETKEITAQPKKVVESKEYHFSSEEIKALIDEVENLKKEIIDLKSEKYVEEQPTDTVEFSKQEEVKPISYNPENTTPVDWTDLTPKAPMSGLDKILERIYNK
jgi:hypothetical protein